MINKLLTAKHWQLFLLTFGLQLVLQIALIFAIFHAVNNDNMDSDPFAIFAIIKYFPIVMVLYMIVYLAWIYSVSIGLQPKVPANVMMKVKKFKIFFYIPIVYYFVFMIGFSILFASFSKATSESNFVFLDQIFPFLFPIHLFVLFCMFYTLYFAAKTIKTVELQREVKFGEFVGEFFLIWFYFIGVWILQPKVNKMVEDGRLDANHFRTSNEQL